MRVCVCVCPCPFLFVCVGGGGWHEGVVCYGVTVVVATIKVCSSFSGKHADTCCEVRYFYFYYYW